MGFGLRCLNWCLILMDLVLINFDDGGREVWLWFSRVYVRLKFMILYICAT